jgi:hypothetical protein
MDRVSFSDTAIVACGTMSLELNHLKNEGFLDAKAIYYTTPGLHQDPHELERQVIDRVTKAKQNADRVIVVYGGKFCYVNADQPQRRMKTIIDELGPGVSRVQASHCIDMVLDEAGRQAAAQEMAGGEPVWWMTPGWIKFRHEVFAGWDKTQANENFPRHTGGAMVADAIGYVDQYMADRPEDFLEYCDWMGIPMMGYPVSLDRFKDLLAEQVAG